MVLHTVWDTPSEAGEFLDAYMTYGTRRCGQSANETAGGLSCWQAADTLCVTLEGDAVIVVLGPDELAVAQVLEAISD